MPISSSADARVRRLCRSAAMLCLAMALSYLEVLCPLSLFLPLPGVKLGLANVVITVLFFLVSPIDAAVVSTVRVLLSALLFGTPASLFFSALGALGAYLVLLVCRLLPKRFFTYIGVSILSATGHHAGQITAACALFGKEVVTAYFPVLLFAGIVTGGVTGLLLNLTVPRLEKFFGKGSKQ